MDYNNGIKKHTGFEQEGYGFRIHVQYWNKYWYVFIGASKRQCNKNIHVHKGMGDITGQDSGAVRIYMLTMTWRTILERGCVVPGI